MAWGNDSRREGQRLSHRNRTIRHHFYCGSPCADQSEKVSPVPLLVDNCRDDDRWYHAGRLLRQIARHRVHRWFNHFARLCDWIATNLALVHRQYIDPITQTSKMVEP